MFPALGFLKTNINKNVQRWFEIDSDSSKEEELIKLRYNHKCKDCVSKDFKTHFTITDLN